MGPIWGRQDPGGPHVGTMNLAIWVCTIYWCLFDLLWMFSVDLWDIFFRVLHSSELLHWHLGNWMVSPVPLKLPIRIFIDKCTTTVNYNKLGMMCIIPGMYCVITIMQLKLNLSIIKMYLSSKYSHTTLNSSLLRARHGVPFVSW